MKESLQKQPCKRKKRKKERQEQEHSHITLRGFVIRGKYAHNFYLHFAVITVCLKITFSLLLSKLLRYFLSYISGKVV